MIKAVNKKQIETISGGTSFLVYAGGGVMASGMGLFITNCMGCTKSAWKNVQGQLNGGGAWHSGYTGRFFFSGPTGATCSVFFSFLLFTAGAGMLALGISGITEKEEQEEDLYKKRA